MITANPKTAGVARWNFLALWGHRMSKGDAAAEEFVTKARPHAGKKLKTYQLPSHVGPPHEQGQRCR